jgi:hypothetical protein
MQVILLIIAVILIIALMMQHLALPAEFNLTSASPVMLEGFKQCSACDQQPPPATGSVVINPFTWPYSGSADPDTAAKGHIAVRDVPLTNLFTPDHVVLTN